MKNLKLISFVGVDEQTNFDDVCNFVLKSSIAVEFSVLYSDSKSQTKDARYPDYNFCLNFLKSMNDNLLSFRSDIQFLYSLHLCGSVIDRYFAQEQDVMDLCQNAYRIQLNLNIRQYPDVRKLSQDILHMASSRNHHLILQENKSKISLINEIMSNHKNEPISILHDASGGFGREISVVKPPYQEYFTGYAGGIKPDNVASIVHRIENVCLEPASYYIDMESGVRENNVFSLVKCQQVIDNLKNI